MQNIPVVLALSQSADPHMQLPPSLAEVPSVILQNKCGREQVLDVVLQTMPVPLPLPLFVQAVLPHMQAEWLSAWLGADPSVILQAWAVRLHMQVFEVEQVVVEAVFVFK